jgi:predicted flavoprotein YhiN
MDTDRGSVTCRALVVATGGLSIPKIGATDFGLPPGAAVRPARWSRPARAWCR